MAALFDRSRNAGLAPGLHSPDQSRIRKQRTRRNPPAGRAYPPAHHHRRNTGARVFSRRQFRGLHSRRRERHLRNQHRKRPISAIDQRRRLLPRVVARRSFHRLLPFRQQTVQHLRGPRRRRRRTKTKRRKRAENKSNRRILLAYAHVHRRAPAQFERRCSPTRRTRLVPRRPLPRFRRTSRHLSVSARQFSCTSHQPTTAHVGRLGPHIFCRRPESPVRAQPRNRTSRRNLGHFNNGHFKLGDFNRSRRRVACSF